ncbi:MAG: hypothetical protein ABIP27_04590 [Flavobacterium circumlabens]|uniref:hypothetical protein n=1 Tax=Flavobacterium circumlabens TaxID=2133765 RepID=UPI003266620D
MIDYEKIKKLNNQIAINRERLKTENDFKKKEKLKLRIQIDILKVKTERLN